MRRWAFLLFVVALAATACRGSSAAPTSDASGDAVGNAGGGGRTATATSAPRAGDGIEGLPVDQFALEVGECFNRYTGLQNYQPVEIFTRRSCDQTHDAEVFHKVELPGAATANTYPGKQQLTNESIRICYASFADFIGTAYETSKYQLGYFVPPLERWEDPVARHRTVTCYVTPYAKGTKVVGTARNSQA